MKQDSNWRLTPARRELSLKEFHAFEHDWSAKHKPSKISDWFEEHNAVVGFGIFLAAILLGWLTLIPSVECTMKAGCILVTATRGLSVYQPFVWLALGFMGLGEWIMFGAKWYYRLIRKLTYGDTSHFLDHIELVNKP